MRKTWFIVISAFCIVAAVCFVTAQADDKIGKGSNQVKLNTKAVELVDVLPSADGCPNKQGTTVKLRVISDTPVDLRRYAYSNRAWIPRDFAGKKKGDEITDYMCTAGATFRVYSRPAGSAEAWPKQ
jgi:hypothetical protein